MIHNAPNINHLWTRLLIEELRRNGVDTFYISPGSRSTPLTLAAAQTEGVQTHVHFDERGAAFSALGHAMGAERPTALICTSGTAAANYLPAIVEASQSGIPLIVLTADRPPELTDTGANQAINQIDLYKNFARWEHALPCPTTEMPAQALLTAIDQACHRAQGHDPGPVHINCPFREPLAPTKTGDDWTEYLVPVEPWLGSDDPLTTYADAKSVLSQTDVQNLEEILGNTERGIVIIGRLTQKTDREAAIKIAAKLRWPTLADITAGPFPSDPIANHMTHYDLMLASESFADIFRPDTVLHLGGPFVSKRLLLQLESVRPANYVRVLNHGRRDDPSHLCSYRIRSSVSDIADQMSSSKAIGEIAKRNKNYEKHTNKPWLDQLNEPTCKMDSVTLSESWPRGGEEITEPFLIDVLHTLNGKGEALFLGNSMPVRDADMFLPRYGGDKGSIVVNRGASGIDGNIATAIGFANATGERMRIAIGDVATLHDLNSLAMLRNCDPPVTLIVINNDGGGIFHFLPIAQNTDDFEEYFGTPHGLTFQHAAEMFDLNYYEAIEMTKLIGACGKAEKSSRSTIIEVRTDRQENHRLHQNTIEAVRKALDEDSES
jgi:2-succinyl-5-enolpyruvyl-6-hydroxy-3-cyclohexene-1-carboxylate synthase